jgi:serine phosphatase RsbU (regulator of sigma subunit)
LFLLGELQELRDHSAYFEAFSNTVQATLRTVLPEVSGVELVGGSFPSASLAAVGGDWYDALVLPDGAIGLIVGDAMGHDIDAVIAMAQLRTMVRSGAWLGLPPDQVLAMTDQLAHYGCITTTATVFFGRLTRTGSTAHLQYCNAGHLHPLLRTPDGSVTALDGGSRVLLGTLGTGAPDVDSSNAQVDMPSGSILLLYTDGLVEREGISFDEATNRLIETLSGFDPSAPLSRLCQPLLHSSDARDDTTVFAVRV